ncbi:GNAT family N-acetyltransferase [Nostocoides sp. HKS02]|uniref:GNAT family N-acetyltransferase n=1 Tax=Nostocoides sp. HKS02 TaxID=1813880 RepID=UPI0012B501EC|nr:GNAT family N-acetyltransferase [Tetrasphaera sp. HKS02]QGN58168.1 GNAT family N-acetyltransferase [Tetrasphaera sp. HKS02]
MTTDVRTLPLGSRVVVRWRLDAPDQATGATLTDAVGTLVSADDVAVTVETSRGTVTIALDRVTAAKEIPPKPSRRGAPHLAISVDDLQRVMVPAWGAVDRERLGDWVLRASAGFTQRGNSVVPAGDPGLPLAQAVDTVEAWYAARRLPAKFAVAGPEGFDPADDPLGALLLGRGYVVGSRTVNLTAATAAVAAADPGGPAVSTSPDPGPAWLAAYRGTRSTVPGVTEQVLTGSPRQVFGQITPGGGLSQQLGLRGADAAGTTPVALARLGFASGWAGLGAVWTDPAYRGRGLAAHLTARLADEAHRAGVALIHLQVEHDNAVALRLYHRLGFATHSSYAYLTLTSPDQPSPALTHPARRPSPRACR